MLDQVYFVAEWQRIIGLVLLKARGEDLIFSKDTSQSTHSRTQYQVNYPRPVTLNTFMVTERYYVVQKQTAVTA